MDLNEKLEKLEEKKLFLRKFFRNKFIFSISIFSLKEMHHSSYLSEIIKEQMLNKIRIEKEIQNSLNFLSSEKVFFL